MVFDVFLLNGFEFKMSECYSFFLFESVVENSFEFLCMLQVRKEVVCYFVCLFINGNMLSYEDIFVIKGVGLWMFDYLKMWGERNFDVYFGGDLIVCKMVQQYFIVFEKVVFWCSYLIF